MFDVIATIGLKEAGSFLAKEVLMPLFKGSLEDYTKDFFKGCISDVVGLARQEPVQKAMAEALKAFVDLVQGELEYLELSGAEIRDVYEVPLRKFVKDSDVAEVLGKAFEPDCRAINYEVLQARWEMLKLPALPEEFDWAQIGKQYVREVKGILRSSPELRDLLKLHNQEAMRQGIDELVGISADFDLRKYQESLREQYGTLKLESLDVDGCAYNNLKLWRMFIPQDVRTCQEFNPKVYEIPKEKLKELQQRGELDTEALEVAQLEEYRKSYVDQPIQNVLEVIGRTVGLGQRSRPVADCVVVLGDPGSGKSTLLQYVALEWAEQPVRGIKELAQRPLPLLIELRKYARDRQEKKCNSIVEYLDRGNTPCHLNWQRLHEVLISGDAIALFDGIDEVFDPNLREEVVTDIHRFTNDYPNVQTIATSRWLGYKAQTLRDAGFQHYMLQDLTDKQIAEFIERWHDQNFSETAVKVNKRERLHRATQESKAIRELAGNPLLLTMMAILNRNQELPRNRPELYNQASRVLLHQWDVERNLIEHRLDPVTIDYTDKQAMLRKVADRMQSGADGLAGNIISTEDLEAILIEHLRSMEVDKPRDIARLMIKQLRERNFILCFLGAENYAFVHRTFLEYFAAWSFVWQFEKTQTLSFEALRDQTFGAHWHEESWHEVLRLIAGMLEPSFVGQLIEFLLVQNGKENNFANIFLAAECLLEVRKRSEIQPIATKLLMAVRALTHFDLDYYYQEFFDQEETKLVWEVRTRAVTTVEATWGDSCETLRWLKSLAQEGESWGVRSVALHALARSFKDNPDMLSWLKGCVQEDEDRNVCRAAVKVLARFFKDDPSMLSWLKSRAQEDENGNLRSIAVEELARSFKDDPDTLFILKSRVQEDENGNVRRAAVEALARSFKDDQDTLSILKSRAQEDEEGNVRRAAVEALARSFKDDPDTLFILKSRAQEDEDGNVRSVAVEELARAFKDDPDTRSWLKSRAQEDEDWIVRRAAVEELAQTFKDDPDTLSILKSCVQEDETGDVRYAAVEALVQAFKDNPDLLSWLRSRAQEDEDGNVRSVAVGELARTFKDDPGTLPILKSRAQEDEDGNVRSVAVEELVRTFKDDPDTLPILRSRAQEDEDGNVRSVAVEALGRAFKDDPDTLSILKKRAQEDEKRNVRSVAVQALVRAFKDDPDTLSILKKRAQE
ncbi:MAG TPA: HEAT repeat domain-containing protein, partial [Leptolyngbyaceae cyanobacterium]